MTWATEGSGTQTAVLNTEHQLLSSANALSFVFEVDTKNMANGDVLQLYVKAKTLTGSTAATLYYATFANVQARVVKSIVCVGTGFTAATVFYLRQTTGTGRSFEWIVKSQ